MASVADARARAPIHIAILTTMLVGWHAADSVADAPRRKPKGKPGYEGHPNERVVTIATLLLEAGYQPYMAGEGPLGKEPDMWPAAKGFERRRRVLNGAGDHWRDMQGLSPTQPKPTMLRNGKKIDELPEGYCSSKDFTELIINSIDEQLHDDRPYFAYLTYQAPHGPLAELVSALAPEARDWLDKTLDYRLENWGRPGSRVDYGPSWAQVSMVPFCQCKGALYEGGTRAPLIVAGSGVRYKSNINHSLPHVMDVVPTVLELSNAILAFHNRGKSVAATQGKSMQPLLSGVATAIRYEAGCLGWQLFGNRAIRQSDWKLLYLLKGARALANGNCSTCKTTPLGCRTCPPMHPGKRSFGSSIGRRTALS